MIYEPRSQKKYLLVCHMYKELKEFEEIAEKIYHLLGWYGGSSFKVEYSDHRVVCLFFDGPSDKTKGTKEYKKEIIKFVQENIPDVLGVKFYSHDSGRVISTPFVGIFLRTKKSESKGCSYFWERVWNWIKGKYSPLWKVDRDLYDI